MAHYLPGKSHEQRILAGYSPWGGKKSGTTEPLSITEMHNKCNVLESSPNHTPCVWKNCLHEISP